MRFAKMHGLGNDFVLINGFAEKLPTDLSALAIKVCDRHLGMGADGLIVLNPAQDSNAVARFLIYNDDGSQAETCGNGLRCAALFAKNERITEQDEFVFELIKGSASPSIIDEEFGLVQVDMGQPHFAPKEIPADFSGPKVVAAPLTVEGQELQLTLVSMGNPHAVIFVDDVDSYPIEQLGPKIEKHPAFPQKTNVEFIQVLGEGKLKMRVWERGCGITLACGSGACAAVCAAVQNGLSGRRAQVQLAHGPLAINWAEDDHVYLTGSATWVAQGEFYL